MIICYTNIKSKDEKEKKKFCVVIVSEYESIHLVEFVIKNTLRHLSSSCKSRFMVYEASSLTVY